MINKTSLCITGCNTPVDVHPDIPSINGMCKVCHLKNEWWFKTNDHLPPLPKVPCACGKNLASSVDGQCKFCRELMLSRDLAKKVGVRHRGDGMTLEQLAAAISKGYIA